MTNKLSFKALDWTLKDLTGKSQPMGGSACCYVGHFRQILSVIQGDTRSNIVDSYFSIGPCSIQAFVHKNESAP